jgi:hypothetical protein
LWSSIGVIYPLMFVDLYKSTKEPVIILYVLFSCIA